MGLLYMLWENTHFTLTRYEYHNPCVPEEMDGLRIMQVSDLHNQSFGKGNKRLLSAIRDSKPDVIMITGDLIDSSFTDLAVGIEFVKQAAQIAPVYYCTGNHEHRLPAKELRSFLSALEEAGAVLLLDRAIPFYGSTLVGLRDPGAKKHSLRRILQQKDSEGFTLLLTHKPHYFENYKEARVSLQRGEMSDRFPMGVGTRYNIPLIRFLLCDRRHGRPLFLCRRDEIQ